METRNRDYSKECHLQRSRKTMKIGHEYQAVIPDLISEGPCPSTESEKALLVWAPCSNIDDLSISYFVVDKYINEAKEKYGYNVEQSLGMLFWHKYDLEKARADIQNYTPFPDEWSVEDKVLFEQGFQFHGKSFNRIRQMYYYLWKKARSRTSLMDKQVRKFSLQREDGSGSEAPSDNESDMDTDKKMRTEHHVSSGTMRTSTRHNPARSKRKPPRGMHLNYDDLVSIVTSSNGEEDVVQNNKQIVSQLKHKLSPGIDAPAPPESGNRCNNRWLHDELLLAVQGLRRYGRDFKAVAEVIGTKNEASIRNFFINYRRRYNLDNVLKEYDAEHGTNQETEEKMETESVPSVGTNSHPNSPGCQTQAAPPLLHPPQSPSNSSNVNGQQRLCPPSLQQASSTR
ncbi:hypothetical protein CEXT_427471 [Caerostris extrusa]|uniref:REST corepressor 3 n=1 Tax=Caerostris extrusa TaxID=172846 RepID=A0AAV4PZ54_CAEEX|nr:hypothetical protein CEXT_427471 [Caerostris extrusa]